MAFPFSLGFSFAKKSEKSSSNSVADKTENIFQNQNTTTQGTTAGSEQQTSNTNSSGTSNTSQTGTTSTDAVKTSTGASTTSLYGTDVLKGLQDSVLSMLGSAKGSLSPTDLSKLSSFNHEAYVNGTVDAATARENQGLDVTKGGIGDMVGSKIGNSSMATLLADRATNDSAASLAGIRAQTESTATGIDNENLKTKIGAASESDALLANILSALKGGTQTSTQAGTEGTTGTSTNTASGTTNTSESSKVDQSSTSLQTINQLVNALLNGTSTSHATEATTGKSSGTTIGATASVGK